MQLISKSRKSVVDLSGGAVMISYEATHQELNGVGKFITAVTPCIVFVPFSKQEKRIFLAYYDTIEEAEEVFNHFINAVKSNKNFFEFY